MSKITLTARELQIVKLLADGKQASEIACEMGLTANTVNGYKRDIMRYVGIHTAAGLVGAAFRQGWIE